MNISFYILHLYVLMNSVCPLLYDVVDNNVSYMPYRLLHVYTSNNSVTILVDPRSRPLWCYQCLSYSDSKSEENVCGDPFNRTYNPTGVQIPTIKCDGYCVKWIRNVSPGNIYSLFIQRYPMPKLFVTL